MFGVWFELFTVWLRILSLKLSHRYSEFDALDIKLRKIFPNLSKNMPLLPKKDYLNSKKSDFILQRRAALEEYMNKIVQTMPSIIRSDAFDEFLSIKERIFLYKQSFSSILTEEKRRISSGEA